jgi:hypothetical protein
MTGDATIGGTSRIDFRGSNNGLHCAGHALTIKNTETVAFCTGTALQDCANVTVADNGIFQPCSGCVLDIAGGVSLVNGGVFANWGTQSFNIPVRASEGTGTIRSDNSSFTFNGPVTVESGKTLSIGVRGTWYSTVTNEADASIVMKTGSAEFRDIGTFVNNGLVDHSAGELRFGHDTDSSVSCQVENNGTIRTSGGSFHFNAASVATGTGTFEIAGGTPDLAGDFSGFTGKILLKGGTASIGQPATFSGTLVLRDGAFAAGTSLAGFPGTAKIDLKGRDLPFDVEGRNWFAFSAGKEVIVDTGIRTFAIDNKLISWTTPPANHIRFKLANGQRNGRLYADATGVFFRAAGLIISFR